MTTQTFNTKDESAKLRVVVVGHVDHGKSTLIGRIFFDTDTLPEGKVEAIRKASEAEGMPFEYAFLLDALLEEQEQNITIDTTQIPFRTQKRGYVIIDAPGHREFLKNMVTGAASADAAILIISAPEGVREQSRRHGYLLRLLGVRQVVVVINKMDLAGYGEARFREVQTECADFLAQIGLTAQAYIPVSAREGDNIARHATEQMPWYDGPTVLETLDSFAPPRPEADLPVRFPVQDVYRFDARRLIAGRIETGTLHVGDTLTFAPDNKTGIVKTIERWSGPNRNFAVAGESVAVTLEEQIFVQRGAVAGRAGADAPQSARRLRANLFWMAKEPLAIGQAVTIKLATQKTTGRITQIERVLDASTLAEREGADAVLSGDVAEVVLETDTRIAFDGHDRIPTLGRFVLVQNKTVGGGGIVLGAAPVAHATPTSRNIVWSDAQVSVHERAERSGHRGAIVWMTGLSGAGKSTIVEAVNRQAFEAGWQVTVLDGDNLRHGLNGDLGFSPEDRAENIRRAVHVAVLLAQTGLVTLCSFISPYQSDRAEARQIAATAGVEFIEVFVDAPLETVEARDPKGLYKRARAGEITQFTGIDAPYEVPASPDVTLHTSDETRAESAGRLWEEVRARLTV